VRDLRTSLAGLVLFNKANRNSPDTERRNAQVPRRGTLGSSGGIFITRGMSVENQVQVFEPRGSFPLAMNGSLELSQIPFGVWTLPNGRSLDLFILGLAHTRRNLPGPAPKHLEAATFAEGHVIVYGDDDDAVRLPDD